MKKLIIALMLAPMTARAEPGCFTSDWYTCSHSPVACFFSLSTDSYFYGDTVAYLCNDIYTAVLQRDQAAADAITFANSYGACNADFNTLVGDYNNLVYTIKVLNSKVKKLKKKCGAACKGIK